MLRVKFSEIHFNGDNVPISPQFDDVYFSTQDGLQETEYVFLQGNQLWQRWQQYQLPHFVIAETGFGTGLNFFATISLFRQFRQQFPDSPLKRLFFISFEKYPLSQAQLQQAHLAYPQFAPIAQQLQQNWQEPIKGCMPIHFAETRLDLWFGDIAESLPQLGEYMYEKIDAWFLDGFAPSKNPDMWNENLYRQMVKFTKANGSFATFTAASQVRKGLQNVGFSVQKRKGYGKKRECLAGFKTFQNSTPLVAPYYLPQPALLDQQDIAIIGGGVASLFASLSLLKRGAKITLYCADECLAQNASGNKQGAFYPQLSDDDERNIRFYIHAFFYGKQHLEWLAKQGIEFDLQNCGVALCGYDNRSAAKLEKIANYAWNNNLYQNLNQTELSKKVGLPLPVAGGFIHQGGWLSPQKLVENAFAYCIKLGLQLKTSQQINQLQLSDHSQNPQWILTNQQGESFQHEVVILANGHKINQFNQTEKLPVYSVRGQVSQIPTTKNLLKLKTVLCYDGYLTPVDGNQHSHCIGASHIRNCENRDFSPLEQQQNQQRLQQNIAEKWTIEINTSDNQAHIGIRCALRDRLPMVGNVPNFSLQQQNYRNLFNLKRRKQPIAQAANYPNLYLISALASRGLTSAPLLGEVLTSLIYNEPLPLSQDIIQALSANRSWVRKWLKGSEVI